MSYVRTEAHRQAARERALAAQPWKHSTGPRTPEGKAASARNAYRGGLRPTLRRFARLLREQRRQIDEVRA